MGAATMGRAITTIPTTWLYDHVGIAASAVLAAGWATIAAVVMAVRCGHSIGRRWPARRVSDLTEADDAIVLELENVDELGAHRGAGRPLDTFVPAVHDELSVAVAGRLSKDRLRHGGHVVGLEDAQPHSQHRLRAVVASADAERHARGDVSDAVRVQGGDESGGIPLGKCSVEAVDDLCAHR